MIDDYSTEELQAELKRRESAAPSRPEPLENPDFAILKNCHINSDATCDAAAERMARSKDACDREIGRLWIAARTRA